MKTQKQLYEKYLSDLTELQNRCMHSKIYDWMEQQWAPGHSTGKEVRVCENCGAIVESRST